MICILHPYPVGRRGLFDEVKEFNVSEVRMKNHQLWKWIPTFGSWVIEREVKCGKVLDLGLWNGHSNNLAVSKLQQSTKMERLDICQNQAFSSLRMMICRNTHLSVV